MLSNTLTMGLIGAYVVLMITCLVEKRFEYATYWLGAIILNIAVLVGMK